MSFVILGLGTALPVSSVTQEHAAELTSHYSNHDAGAIAAAGDPLSTNRHRQAAHRPARSRRSPLGLGRSGRAHNLLADAALRRAGPAPRPSGREPGHRGGRHRPGGDHPPGDRLLHRVRGARLRCRADRGPGPGPDGRAHPYRIHGVPRRTQWPEGRPRTDGERPLGVCPPVRRRALQPALPVWLGFRARRGQRPVRRRGGSPGRLLRGGRHAGNVAGRRRTGPASYPAPRT